MTQESEIEFVDAAEAIRAADRLILFQRSTTRVIIFSTILVVASAVGVGIYLSRRLATIADTLEANADQQREILAGLSSVQRTAEDTKVGVEDAATKIEEAPTLSIETRPVGTSTTSAKAVVVIKPPRKRAAPSAPAPSIVIPIPSASVEAPK